MKQHLKRHMGNISIIAMTTELAVFVAMHKQMAANYTKELKL